MKFEPRSKEELSNLLPEGVYDACITKAEEKTSKTSQAPMLVLDLEIYDAEGRPRSVTDRLIFMDKTMFKIHNFCECAGLMDQYNAGDLSARDCEGKSVTVKIVRKEDENFGDKNEVKKYVVKKEKAAPAARKAEPNRKAAEPIKTGDDIPFAWLAFLVPALSSLFC